MKTNTKKQKKKLIITITAVVLAAWLVVSLAYSAVILVTEKNRCLREADISSVNYFNAISPYDPTSLYFHTNTVKNGWTNFDLEKSDEIGNLKSVDNNIFNTDIHIVFETNSEDIIPNYDTDKEIYTSMDGIDEKGYPKKVYGMINYNNLRKSVSDEQYESIKKYLTAAHDKDGNYYELICTEFYYDKEGYAIIPKTLEIVRSNSKNELASQDEKVEKYELNPEISDGIESIQTGDFQKNVISDQFFLGEFTSGGLVEENDIKLYYEYYNPYEGNLVTVDSFNYIYKRQNVLSLQLMHTLNDLNTMNSFEYQNGDQTDELPVTVVICYAKKINILDNAKTKLIYGISGLFLFFFIIAFILIIMIWKVIKTQIEEQKKRTEVTNALAHDIKTPLFIIEGYAQSLKENLYTEKREHYADKIITHSKEVNSLVHKMLDFSSLLSTSSELKIENIDTEKLLSDIVSDFKELSKNKEILLNVKKGTTIAADKNLLSRALSNILDNAVKHSDENSEIKILADSNSIIVSNICSKITQEDIKHITEPYYVVDSSRKGYGNGLGLSVVKTICDMHGFVLKISLKDKNISFEIKLSK